MKLIAALLLFYFASLQAADIPLEFDNKDKEARYHHLLEEIRCLVCQNQSLADSSADLAQDLRNEVYLMVLDNQSEQEIMQFLVDRYGDFVLYRPRLQGNTWLLWLGPFALLLMAILVAVIIIKRQSKKMEDETILSQEQQRRLERIISKDKSQ